MYLIQNRPFEYYTVKYGFCMLSLMGISYKRMESGSCECSINCNLYNRINKITKVKRNNMPNWCSNYVELTHAEPEMLQRAQKAFNEGRSLYLYLLHYRLLRVVLVILMSRRSSKKPQPRILNYTVMVTGMISVLMNGAPNGM